ncbi:MAG TPA: hypothetical protein PK381_05735 [Anaerolineaceae bacterium]|nr:hypothetical protein [Anaerolineaceae bacterium]
MDEQLTITVVRYLNKATTGIIKKIRQDNEWPRKSDAQHSLAEKVPCSFLRIYNIYQAVFHAVAALCNFFAQTMTHEANGGERMSFCRINL